MEESLQIAMVQPDLFWKDKEQNSEMLEQMLMQHHAFADIFVLPELFNTAFCVDDKSLAESEKGKSVKWMQKLAKYKEAVIAGSILIREDKKIYNRFLWVDKDGIQYHYDKHHLFSLVNEAKHITAGKKHTLIRYKGWKIQPHICYDLRFPAWCQNNLHVDLQIYIASWPQKRVHHWKTLLRARAIENQCFVLGVNRIGKDGYEHLHNGHSCAFDFKGDLLCDMQDKNGIEIVELNKTALKSYRRYYPFWKDR